MERKILGLTEVVKIIGEGNGKVKVVKILARIDTGATKSSIDRGLLKRLGIKASKKKSLFKSAVGRELRKMVKISVVIKGKEVRALFSITSREHMNNKVIIGQNVLKMGRFLVDPLKT